MWPPASNQILKDPTGGSRAKTNRARQAFRRANATIALDSKYPFGFDASGRIKFFGRLAPNKPRTPARADVPLRCMPRTRIQIGRFCRATERVWVLERLGTCRFTNQHLFRFSLLRWSRSYHHSADAHLDRGGGTAEARNAVPYLVRWLEPEYSTMIKRLYAGKNYKLQE